MFKNYLLKRFAFILCFIQTVLAQNSQEKLFLQSIKSIVFKIKILKFNFQYKNLENRLNCISMILMEMNVITTTKSNILITIGRLQTCFKMNI